MSGRSFCAIATVSIAMSTLVGCGWDEAEVAGSPAVWSTADGLSPASTSFTADVLRLECSGGRTGEVLPPQLEWSESQLTVPSRAVPLPTDVGQRCPMNDRTPYVVMLDRPIGDRDVVDGACASVAQEFDWCSDGGLRWRAG